MKVWGKAFFLFLIFISQSLYAVEVNDLYEVEVVAKSEQELDKKAAIKDAMRRVLGRILVGNNLFQDKTVASMVDNAADYVTEFQFSLSEAGTRNERQMRVLFNEKWIVNTLRSEQRWIWNEIRPRTLIWLVVEEDGVQRFFDPDEIPEIDWVLKKASKQKKIPILYPMQDLKEKRIVSIADVMSVYSEHLMEVSVRYEVVSTLAGKIVKDGQCWKGEWTLYFDGKIEQWRTQCSTVDDVTLFGLQGVYDRLSVFYAAKYGQKKVEEATLRVSGIQYMSEVMRLIDYLESQPLIQTATWLRAENGYNIYRVFYKGYRDDLIKQLSIERVIRPENYLNHSPDELNYYYSNK